MRRMRMGRTADCARALVTRREREIIPWFHHPCMELISSNAKYGCAARLGVSNSPIKIQIGTQITKGLGAGSTLEIGRQSFGIPRWKSSRTLEGATDLYHSGMGGRTGTGATPVIAEIARDAAFWPLPWLPSLLSEGKKRNIQAEEGHRPAAGNCRYAHCCSNQRFWVWAARNLSLLEAFKKRTISFIRRSKGYQILILVPDWLILISPMSGCHEQYGYGHHGYRVASGEKTGR